MSNCDHCFHNWEITDPVKQGNHGPYFRERKNVTVLLCCHCGVVERDLSNAKQVEGE